MAEVMDLSTKKSGTPFHHQHHYVLHQPQYLPETYMAQQFYFETHPLYVKQNSPLPSSPSPVASMTSPGCSPPASSISPHSAEITSTSTKMDLNFNSVLPVKPTTRPFKAIDPIALRVASFGDGDESAEAYAEFRQRIISNMEGSVHSSNNNMRRSVPHSALNDDPTYLEKRRKNNEAAKRSRDARKAKEDEMAIRCAFLEQENIKLKLQLVAIEKQKRMLLSLPRH